MATSTVTSTMTSTIASELLTTTSSERSTYLFGYPIRHSLSPLLHNTIYPALSLPWTYHLHETPSIPSFLPILRNSSTVGAAITMPHKVSIIPYLDVLTPAATTIGAVNTIFYTTNPSSGARILNGTNTDCIGIRESIKHNISSTQLAALRDRPALIVGGGGTSRAAVYALSTFFGASPIYMLNRDAAELAAVMSECDVPIIPISSLAQAGELAPPALVISAIPDFEPATLDEVRVRESLQLLLSRAGEGVLLEMCYHPSSKTAITAVAKGAGWLVVPGTEAMIWQGVEQVQLWTGKKVDEKTVERVKDLVREALAKH